MKHSLPSGAQRTCQSPKVSRTISITSGCGRVAGGRRRGGRGAAGAAGAAGASAAGAAGAAGGRSLGAPGAAGRRRAAGASAAGAGVSWAASGRGERQPERGQDQADSDRLHRAARILLCDCVSRGDCHSRRRLSTAPWRRSAEARAQVKRAPEGTLFPAFATSLSDWPNVWRGRYDG